MMLSPGRLVALLSAFVWCVSAQGGTFRVASYNVENYLDQETDSRKIKPEDSKAKVRESILSVKPDVIAFQEMGQRSALEELQGKLKKEGLDLPYLEHVPGMDTNVHVGVLSRFPFSARRPHSKENYLLGGRRFQVSRGFAEVDVQVSPDYSFTLLVAHLKSKRAVPEADEAEMRYEEAKILRDKVDDILAKNPQANVLVAGDFNDTRDSRGVRFLVGRGKTKLIDTRPAERNGDNLPSANPAWDPRNITWTHYYGKEDSYSRIDYILASPGMAKEWHKEGTYILTLPNWGVASDHRPIVAEFEAADR